MVVKLHSSLFVSGKIMAFPTCLLELYSCIGTIELGLTFRLGVANGCCFIGVVILEKIPSVSKEPPSEDFSCEVSCA